MTHPLVAAETPAEGVRELRLQDAARDNALSEPLVAALVAALAAAGADPAVRCVLLTGLPRVFCAGADPEMLRSLVAGGRAPTELVRARHLLELPVPVVAAAEGPAVGGGLALLLSADLVFLAEEARYGANFTALGITPGMGSTCLLEHALSPAVAHELLYTGRYVRGRELRALGAGVNGILPAAQVRAAALDRATRVALVRRAALGALKRTLTLSRREALQRAFTLESLMHEVSRAHLDTGGLP